MPTLTVKSGPAAGRSLPIDGDLVIGREGADLTIDDQELSRRHVLLRPAGQGVRIEDLGSLNGTFVDGRRIEEPVTITTGATLEVGGSRVAIELTAPEGTRVSDRPVAAVDQPTRPRDVAAAPAPAAAPSAPDRPAEDAAPARSRLLVVGGVIVAVAVLAVALVLLLGGDSEEATARTLDGTVSTLPLGDPTSFQVSGVLDGEPIDSAAVVVQRRFAGQPREGGKPVPVRGFMLLTPPGGNLTLHFRGTMRLTSAGGEQLRARGTATNGTRDFQGAKGSFRMTGGRPSSRAGTAKYRLTGKLEY